MKIFFLYIIYINKKQLNKNVEKIKEQIEYNKDREKESE